jgi:hypothetical protein
MSREWCPACEAPVLLVDGARQGGTKQVFDPVPGTGPHYDTRLSDDLTHVAAPAAAAQNLKGRMPLYRSHRWSCPNQLKVPAGKKCPSWGGYSQAAAASREPAPEPSWPQPWTGIRGTARDRDDLLSLEPAAMPRRRLMAAMALALHRATLTGPAAAVTGRRVREPVPGDVVAEVTTARKPGSERRGFGVLVARRREWVSAEAAYSLAMGDDGDEMRGEGAAGGEVFYVQFGPGERDVVRWECGEFVAAAGDGES